MNEEAAIIAGIVALVLIILAYYLGKWCGRVDAEERVATEVYRAYETGLKRGREE